MATVYQPNEASILFHDEFLDRWFESSHQEMSEALTTFNRRIEEGDTMTINEFYYLLDLPPAGAGAMLGWDQIIGFRMGTALAADGKPAVEFYFSPDPKLVDSLRR